jgi:hypothetical protein
MSWIDDHPESEYTTYVPYTERISYTDRRWRCNDGKSLKIHEMSTEHIKNCIAMLLRDGCFEKIPQEFFMQLFERRIKALEEEVFQLKKQEQQKETPPEMEGLESELEKEIKQMELEWGIKNEE